MPRCSGSAAMGSVPVITRLRTGRGNQEVGGRIDVSAALSAYVLPEHLSGVNGQARDRRPEAPLEFKYALCDLTGETPECKPPQLPLSAFVAIGADVTIFAVRAQGRFLQRKSRF